MVARVVFEYLIKSPEFVLRHVLPTNTYWETSVMIHSTWRDFDINRYNCPTNPYKIIYVDPSKIEEYSDTSHKNMWGKFGSVSYDELNIVDKKFEESDWYVSLYNHFVNEKPWRETKKIRDMLKKIEYGEECRKETHEQVMNICGRWDKLYQEIKENGYKSQRQLIRDGENVKQNVGKKSFKEAICEEVTVDIGNDGKFLFVDGRHRLAIAKILDLDKIPVVVLCRHHNWMKHREQLYQNGIKEPHPDIATATK